MLDRKRYHAKAEAEGRQIKTRANLSDLTPEQKKDREYLNRRKLIDEKKDKEYAEFPYLKEITRRRKTKKMSEEEIKAFDIQSRLNRKKSLAAYWEENKHRPELKRPGRSSNKYRDDHNLWEKESYSKGIVGKPFVKFVPVDPNKIQPNIENGPLNKEKAKAVVLEE